MKATKKDTDKDYLIGSGNVFADMGLPNPETRLLKARLARLINNAIKAHGWTQQHTAEVLGITQPKVSDISRGRLKNFSVARLMTFLVLLDHRVAITVSKDDLPPEEIVIAAKQLAKDIQAAK